MQPNMQKASKRGSIHNLLESFFSPGDALATIESLKQSIDENPTEEAGEKQYQLGKIYLKLYQEEGQPKGDTSYAMLAQKYFQDAKEKGKTDIKEKHLRPIQDLAKMHYDRGLQIFAEKSETKYLDKSAAFLKNSLAFGGLSDGTVEYTLAKVFLEWDKKDLAYEQYIKAQKAGKKLTASDEKFIHEYLDGDPKVKAERRGKELYEQAKLLFYDKKDRVRALEVMQESIRIDEGEDGIKHYNIAKMYLEAYNIHGNLDDTTYALLALESFQKAIASGRFVDEEKLKPFRDLGALFLKMGREIYSKKEGNYQVEALHLLKKSLDFGGSHEDKGQVEYCLSQLYREKGEKALAYDYLQKSVMAGKAISKADQEFLDIMEAKQEPDYSSLQQRSSFSETKSLAEQCQNKAKKLIEDKDYLAAIDQMKESVRLDEGEKGEKQYILAKLHLAIFLLEGKENDDYTYAILANDWIQKAREKGKQNVNEKSFYPLREAAMAQFEKGLAAYKEKDQSDNLKKASDHLHLSLKLGGVPGGEVELTLAKILLESGEEQMAEEFQKMAILNAKKYVD